MKNLMEKKEKNEVVDTSMFEHVPTGFEETNSETFKTPFLKIIQDLSPERKKSKLDYLEEAEVGMFCNSATKQLYESINIIVLKVSHNLIVWKPGRGGLAGVFDKDQESSIVVKKDGFKKKFDKDGNAVLDTISFYCINVDDPEDIFIFPLSKSSFKYASKFSTKLRMLKANGKRLGVSFAGIWSISTVEDSNDQGSWYTMGDTPTFQRFISADEFKKIVKPALELLKTAETDFNNSEFSAENNEDEPSF